MKNLLFTGVFACFLLTNCGSKQEKPENIASADTVAINDSFSNTPALAKDIDLNTKTPSDKKFIKTGNLKFKVENVLKSTEKIENITFKYGGYIIYSNLQNNNENYNSSRISRDSILISKQIVVENEIQLRIPNNRLDSFIRELNQLVVFLDYRVFKLDDVTLQFAANQKKTERLQNYEQRQSKHIDSKQSKLSETTNAEENLLDRQYQADDLFINSLALEDQLKYCNLTVYIYQKPMIITERIANFEYISDVKPNFLIRIWDSILQGWHILEEVILFLIKIWGIVILIIGGIFAIKYLSQLYKRIK